jgi:2-hydroxy-3-keto-5-methylthiopentenyl-1-phosphate phosphatase
MEHLHSKSVAHEHLLILPRDAFREMMDSITRPFPECVDYLVENITLDPHFNEYFQWALAHNIPTVVVSSGMTPVIRGILQKLVGPDCDKIDIVCNEAVPRGDKTIDQEGGWQIQYHDERCVASVTDT